MKQNKQEIAGEQTHEFYPLRSELKGESDRCRQCGKTELEHEQDGEQRNGSSIRGPWRVGKEKSFHGIETIEVVADIPAAKGRMTLEWPICQVTRREIRNARLIAAAPEMYEALENIVAADEVSGPAFSPLREKARRAIAKATQP